jgi:hypothetical protein
MMYGYYTARSSRAYYLNLKSQRTFVRTFAASFSSMLAKVADIASPCSTIRATWLHPYLTHIATHATVYGVSVCSV